MQKTLLLSLIIFIIFSCASENKESSIDKIFEEYNTVQTPGAAVAVFQNSKIVFKKAYGLADLDKKILNSTKTNFRLASITKQFTAMCILILYEKNELSIEDPITKYFPHFPNYGKKIKIKHLLQHTSGLLAYEDYIDDTVTVQLKDGDVLRSMMDRDSTYFEPGTEYRYSNSGYAVLAKLVEVVGGKSFPDFLDEFIFKPLDMNFSVAYEKEISEVVNRAYGYLETENGFEFSDQSVTSAVLGDGGIYTSVEDMLKWDIALSRSKLISSELMEKSWTKGVLPSGETFDYGYGWRLDEYSNKTRYYHTGSTCGFSNVYMRFPAKNLSIIVLMNMRDKPALELGNKVADLFLQ